jgi:hypothetical protein
LLIIIIRIVYVYVAINILQPLNPLPNHPIAYKMTLLRYVEMVGTVVVVVFDVTRYISMNYAIMYLFLPNHSDFYYINNKKRRHPCRCMILYSKGYVQNERKSQK